METNKLINHLVDDLKPIKPLAPFPVRLLSWMLCAGVVMAGVLAVTGVRRGWGGLTADVWAAMDMILVGAIWMSASWAALTQSVPGNSTARQRSLPWILIGIWSLWTILRVGGAALENGIQAFVPGPHLVCALFIFGIASVMIIPLTWIVNRAAPQDARKSGLLTGLACAGGAMMAVEFICLHDRPVHIFMWHVIPVIMAGLAGSWAGTFLFRQNRNRYTNRDIRTA